MSRPDSEDNKEESKRYHYRHIYHSDGNPILAGIIGIPIGLLIRLCIKGKIKWLHIVFVFALVISSGCLISGVLYIKGGTYWFMRIGVGTYVGMVVASVVLLFASVRTWLYWKKNFIIKETDGRKKTFPWEERVYRTFFIILGAAFVFQLNYHLVLVLGRGYVVSGTPLSEVYIELPFAHIPDLENYKKAELQLWKDNSQQFKERCDSGHLYNFVMDRKNCFAGRNIVYTEIARLQEHANISGYYYMNMGTEYYECRSEQIAKRCVNGWKRLAAGQRYDTALSQQLMEQYPEVDEIAVFYNDTYSYETGERDLFHPFEQYGKKIKFSFQSLEDNYYSPGYKSNRSNLRQTLLIRRGNQVGIFRFNQYNVENKNTYPYMKAEEWMPVYIEKMK